MEGTVGLPLLLSVGSHKEERQLPTFSIKGNNSVLISCGFTWELSLKEPDSICHKLCLLDFCDFFFLGQFYSAGKRTHLHISLSRGPLIPWVDVHIERDFILYFFFVRVGSIFHGARPLWHAEGLGWGINHWPRWGVFTKECRAGFISLIWDGKSNNLFVCIWNSDYD